jgi:hypothetical protein
MPEVRYTEADGCAMLETDHEDEWIESDKVVELESWV